MKKQDWIWVAIRIFGIYLLVLAVISLPKALSASMHLWIISSASGPFEIELLHEATRLLFLTAMQNLTVSLLTVVVFTGIGIYLIRGGGWLFRIVCPPEDEQSLFNKPGDLSESIQL
ncbi:MAG: hypothetical protein N2C14_01695 [Planctomycetales bacterium]